MKLNELGKRSRKRQNRSYRSNSRHRNYKSDSHLNEMKRTCYKPAFFYDYDLVGDDFFFDIAHLNCKQNLEFTATKKGFKGRSVKLCGHCVSGQTIKTVANMVKANVTFNNRIVFNIGSVDLLHGRSFNEMRHDFIEMYSALENRGISAIITTLAPIANLLFSQDMQNRWHQFNTFLLDEFSNVIDITNCFVSDTNRVLFECYQSEPKYVTGSSQAHLLWNNFGRQRVLKHLKDSLAELAYRNSIFNTDF